MNTQAEIRAKAIELAIQFMRNDNQYSISEIIEVAKKIEEYLGVATPSSQYVYLTEQSPFYQTPFGTGAPYQQPFVTTTAGSPIRTEGVGCSCGGSCGCQSNDSGC